MNVKNKSFILNYCLNLESSAIKVKSFKEACIRFKENQTTNFDSSKILSCWHYCSCKTRIKSAAFNRIQGGVICKIVKE